MEKFLRTSNLLYQMVLHSNCDKYSQAKCWWWCVDSVTSIKRNVNCDNVKRKLDGRVETSLTEIVYRPALEGHLWWTLRLLEKKAKVVFGTPVGKSNRLCLKRQASTSPKRILVYPQERGCRIRSMYGGCSWCIWTAIQLSVACCAHGWKHTSYLAMSGSLLQCDGVTVNCNIKAYSFMALE